MPTAIARHLVVHGRVQGVFFRVSTMETASRHGVAGWVANRPDGTVEAWLEGPAEGVATVEAWITDGGPPAARVTRVEGQDAAPVDHRTFEVR